MKKIISGLCLLFIAAFARAQGLEGVIVEKYYVSNAADAAGSVGALPAGSVTYRIYVDMAPNYKFQALYGNQFAGGTVQHLLTLTTSTSFFNNEDRGATTPTYTKAQAAGNTVMLDSWFSVGAACSGQFGIPKSEDNGVANVVNSNGILQNNDPLAGIPLTTQDGLIAGTPQAVTFVGLTTELDVFDATSNVGNSFSTQNGSIASLIGSSGPIAATNRVLIGQFTTDGVFHYELNVQLGTPTGGVETYVAQNALAGETLFPALMGTIGPNVAPTISITSPANGSSFITGSAVAIAATAADTDGNVDSVSFYIDGVFKSKVTGAGPYTYNYTAVAGSHCITAAAVDNSGARTVTACTNIVVANNPPPTVAITSPTNGASFITGSNVAIAATATDNVSVDSVAFYVDGVFLSKVIGAGPYTATYNNATVGSHCITARATDNLGAQTTTACTNITVANNPPPVVTITAPANGTSYITGATVNITASATDNGSVSQVEFFDNGVSIGLGTFSAPSTYSASLVTSTLGTRCITAVATDNNGATATTVCRNINVVSTILPYKVVTSNSTCVPATFCLPIAAVAPVDNVIGYDLVLQYNAAKVTPTGNITVFNNLVTPSWVTAINSIDAANGLMNISLFFNASAPANAEFNGTGNLICVEFSKTAAFTSVDAVTFSIPTLQESYFTGVQSKFADNGTFSTYKDTTFNGKLRFWLDNSALAYDQLNPATYLITNIYGNDATCGAQSAIAVQPDLSGNFSYNTQNGVNVNINRDILGTTDVQPVINGFDALLAQKVLLNDVTFTPSVYKIVAMDVNIDGFISAGDVSQINQRTVLLIPEFKQAWNYDVLGNPIPGAGASKDWLFIDSVRVQTNPAYAISATYPAWDGTGFNKSHSPVVPFCLPVPSTLVNGDCPLITPETYKGVLVGDVNGNYATVGSGGIFRNAGDKVIFDLSKAVVGNGYVDVPVSLFTGETVNALDFALQFNQNNLTFISVITNADYLQSLAHFNADDKTVRFTSFSLKNYDLNKSLVAVRFATASGKINASDLNSLVGYINGEKVAAEVIDAMSESVANVSVYPNPAKDVLNVLVSENATVELFDATGKLAILQPAIAANQKQEINISVLANGVYTLKVYNNNFVTVKKVVINK